ncbi:MAG: family 2 glycosyl transferase [Parcubacteria group bacterium Gr01-1014_66]|nr:MAG: family 2 glycosyl transferase [Parcubacteria group bacterium Gr01-1014_66]
MITKIDYAIGILIGFLVGIFAIPTLIHLEIRNPTLLLSLPWIFACLFGFGIWLGKYLSRFFAPALQLAKFAAVGFLNTAIHFAVLNSLSLLTGITRGFEIGGINVPAFAAAVTSGYFCNKLWVFKLPNQKNEPFFADFAKYLFISIGGLIINTVIVVGITTYVQPLFMISLALWLNIATIIAIMVSMIWNFLGYKLIVFRK